MITTGGGLVVMNGNVGIGTWMPASLLTVSDTLYNPAIRLTNSAYGGYIDFIHVYSHGSADLILNLNGNPAVFFDSAHLGIGIGKLYAARLIWFPLMGY